MACTEQKKKLLKRRRKHSIKTKNNTTLFDRLPKIRLVNNSKILGPVNGKKIDIDEYHVHLPLKKKASKRSTVTQVTDTAEEMRSPRALTCRTSQFGPDVLEGALVYSIAQEKHASFYFSGTEISRLLTFVQKVDGDMQTLMKKINPDISPMQENDIDADMSFTLAINLHNVGDYFDMHDMCCLKISKHSSLRKVENVTELATLPVNTTSSIFTISIERQSMVVQIICFKLNALCEQFWTTLATMSSKLVTASMARNVPSILLHNWHFRDITQGYLLKYLLNSTKTVTLNSMRTLYFVIITSPYSHFNLNINLQCSKNGIFTTLDPKPVSDFGRDPMCWSKLHEAVWVSSMHKKLLVDESRQVSGFSMKSEKSDTLLNPSPRLEEADLKKVYIHSEAEYINSHFSESTLLISNKRSIGIMCNLSSEKPCLETVLSKKSTNDSISKIISADDDVKMDSLKFLGSKFGFAMPKISVERNNLCFSRFYSGYISKKLYFATQTLKDQYLNKIEQKKFGKVFLKSFGKTLIATLFTTLI